MTDMELIELLRSEPERGLAEVVRQYSHYVLKIANTRLGGICSREDIEEAVSDIFLRFYTVGRRSGFAVGSVRSSLSLIAGRHCINVFNKKCSRQNDLALDDFIEFMAAETDDKELSLMLTEAVKKLGEPDTEIFLRKYFFGQKTEDIAKEINMKPNTVDKRISRGLVKLRIILEEES